MLRGGLRPKKNTPNIKLPSRDISAIERATEQVHTKKEEDLPTVSTPAPVEKAFKRTSIDFPLSYYQAIKRTSFDRNITFREFVLKLIQKDLNLEDFK